MRLLRLSAYVLTCAWLVGSADPALAYYVQGYYHGRGAGMVTRPKWMSTLRDDLALSELTIPGTHDSGTFADYPRTPTGHEAEGEREPEACFDAVCPIPLTQLGAVHNGAQTQSMDYRTQLMTGIRALDIRLGQIAKTRCDGSDLWIVHSDKACFPYTFDEVMSDVTGFLHENPSETVLIRLGNDGEKKVQGFDGLVRGILNKYKADIYQFSCLNSNVDGVPCAPGTEPLSHNPLLRDMRGKIVVLQDWTSNANVACGGAQPWPFCGDKIGIPHTKAVDVTGDPAVVERAQPFVISDDYAWGAYDLGRKWHVVDKAFRSANDGKCAQEYITYLSAAGAKDSDYYLSAAAFCPFPNVFPYFYASGKCNEDTNGRQAMTGWTVGVYCPTPQCLEDDFWSIFGGNAIYFKGMNQLALEHINDDTFSRLGIVYADFPNPGYGDDDFYTRQGLIGMLINANTRPRRCTGRVPRCGDGIVDPPEVCDDGNALDGDCCSADCRQITPAGTKCDDGDACTLTAKCDAEGNCIRKAAKAKNTPCDMNSCITGARCSATSNGRTVPMYCKGGKPKSGSCEPDDPCAARGTCVFGHEPDGVTLTADCKGDGTVSCDDGNPCTADSCVPGHGCVHDPVPDDTTCDDNDPCTPASKCTAGFCKGRLPCEDNDPCTYATCDPTTHVCSTLRYPDCRSPVCGDGVLDRGEVCDDGNTSDGDSCSSDCQTFAAGVSCADGDACTLEAARDTQGACVPSKGVEVGTPCDDHDANTETSACRLVDGSSITRCLPPVSTTSTTIPGCPDEGCDDGDGCTDDSCDAGSGCVHVKRTGLSGVLCRCGAYPAACGSATVPQPIGRKFSKACVALESVAGASGKRRTKLLGRAGRLLRASGRATLKASQGKTPKLAAECSTALESVFSEMLGGLQAP